MASLGIDEDLKTMLQFYHDLGRIIYFGHLSNDKSFLKDTVILNPQWLINVFKEVITIKNQEEMVSSNYSVFLFSVFSSGKSKLQNIKLASQGDLIKIAMLT